MLYMVIERFKPGSVERIGERFRQRGRMLPEGVVYHASWVEPSGRRCFQIMEASEPAQLERWMEQWNDLVDFEVMPVLTSAEYWNRPTTM